MESILVSTIAARVTINILDRLLEKSSAKKRNTEQNQSRQVNERPSIIVSRQEESPSEETNEQHSEHENNKNAPLNGDGECNSTDFTNSSVVDETNVESLEEKVKELRAQATQLTSADTFVQYARVTREANRLEKLLKDVKGNEDTVDGLVDMDRIGKVISSALSGQASQSTRSAMKWKIIGKIIVQLVVVAFLWWRFSYGRHDSMRGQVMRFDCKLVRPLSWMFRRHTVMCQKDDWTCAANVQQSCSVSFIMGSALCNAAVSLLADVLITKVWR